MIALTTEEAEQHTRELALTMAELAQLEQDCMTLALRLAAEPVGTMSPECQLVMDRWRPKCEKLISKST